MKLDSNWEESILDTSNIFVAPILAVLFEGLLRSIQQDPVILWLVVGVELIAVAAVIGVAVLLQDSRESFKRFRILVIRAARWIIGGLAGALFGTGYSLIFLDWRIGVPITALYFGFVVTVFHYSRIVEKENPKLISNKFGLTRQSVLSYFYDIILASFFLSLIGVFVIFAYSAWYYVSPGTVSLVSNMATLFITVQGVLLAISVISHAANRTFIVFTATSLLISVITFMVAQMGSPFINIWGIKNGFLFDSAFFALSIVYYVRIATKALTENPRS